MHYPLEVRSTRFSFLGNKHACLPVQFRHLQVEDLQKKDIGFQVEGLENEVLSGSKRRVLLLDYVAGLEEADQLVLRVYNRCVLNPGGALERLAAGAEKALETSSPGAIWFTRYVQTRFDATAKASKSCPF